MGYDRPMTCAVDGCNNAKKCRGYCGKHYENFRKTGNPVSKHEAKRDAPKPPCSVEGCDRDAKTVGLCNRHYENQRLRGRAVPQRDLDLGDRIREVGWTVTERGCWEWDGQRNELGYGLFNSKRQGLERARAHRVVWEYLTGRTLGDAVLCHTCDNPPCVNPEHLFPGSQADNVADMTSKGRHWLQGRTECKYGHDLTAEGATRTTRRGDKTYQACVACTRRRSRAWEAKNRQASRLTSANTRPTSQVR